MAKENPVPFPKRAHGLPKSMAILLPEPMRGSAKIFLRNVAKNQLRDYYHRAIETGIFGESDSGEKIPINTLGRWVFGTPGYMGHIRVSNWDESSPRLCTVDLPEHSPTLAWEFLEAIRREVESLSKNKPRPQGESLPGSYVLEQARRWIEEKRPQASEYKKAAFANSVMTILTGWSGGYGGPSVREHTALRMYGEGKYTFESVVELLNNDDGPIFGPLTDIHRECWEEEYCFDDDPQDIAELGSES
jgi:hypothetical protein